jgi:MYXO-CTERM domain-containing protein
LTQVDGGLSLLGVGVAAMWRVMRRRNKAGMQTGPRM